MILWQPCAYFVLHRDVQFEISLKRKVRKYEFIKIKYCTETKIMESYNILRLNNNIPCKSEKEENAASTNAN